MEDDDDLDDLRALADRLRDLELCVRGLEAGLARLRADLGPSQPTTIMMTEEDLRLGS